MFWGWVALAAFAVMESLSAVPDFLKLSGFWQWVVNNTVMMVSAAATSFGLDYLAAKLSGPEVDRRWLQLLGLLLVCILLPGLDRNYRAPSVVLILTLWVECDGMKDRIDRVLDAFRSVPFRSRFLPAFFYDALRGSKLKCSELTKRSAIVPPWWPVL
eukprot:507005-Amphidinium_carterae.1